MDFYHLRNYDNNFCCFLRRLSLELNYSNKTDSNTNRIPICYLLSVFIYSIRVTNFY